MVVLGDLNARVRNEIIERIGGQHVVPGRNESGNDYWRCVQTKSQWRVTVGSKKMVCINTCG